jgi:putative PIN family toxin of toxin-antitoxin system
MKGKRKIRPRVVVDTNVFFNSWIEDMESCNYVLNLISTNRIKLLFSQDTIGEFMYMAKNYCIANMSSDKSRILFMQSLAEMFYLATSVNTVETSCPELNDPYDEMFLKCAIAGKADFLVSNDFTSGLHTINDLNIKIVSSGMFKEIYQENY